MRWMRAKELRMEITRSDESNVVEIREKLSKNRRGLLVAKTKGNAATIPRERNTFNNGTSPSSPPPLTPLRPHFTRISFFSSETRACTLEVLTRRNFLTQQRVPFNLQRTDDLSLLSCFWEWKYTYCPWKEEIKRGERSLESFLTPSQLETTVLSIWNCIRPAYECSGSSFKQLLSVPFTAGTTQNRADKSFVFFFLLMFEEIGKAYCAIGRTRERAWRNQNDNNATVGEESTTQKSVTLFPLLALRCNNLARYEPTIAQQHVLINYAITFCGKIGTLCI